MGLVFFVCLIMIFPVICICGFVNVQLIVFTWGPPFQTLLSMVTLLMPFADTDQAQGGHSPVSGWKVTPEERAARSAGGGDSLSHPIPAPVSEMGVFAYFLLLCKVYLIFFSLIKSFSLWNCQNLSLHLQLQENENHWLRNPLYLPIVNRSAGPIVDSSQVLVFVAASYKVGHCMLRRFTH